MYFEYRFKIGRYTLHLVYKEPDPIVTSKIDESKSGYIGKYRYRLDRANSSTLTQDHIHLYKRDNQLLAINKDGSGHDSFHGMKIPNVVADELRTLFPEFNIPDSGMLESLSRAGRLILNIESCEPIK